MNVYAQIILVTLFLEYALTIVGNFLNLRALRSEPPREFADVYDADAYRKSQEYTRATTRFQFRASTVDLAALLLFWWAGGFQFIDVHLRGFGLSTVTTGLAYIAVLSLAKMLLDLPFNLWSTFVIEERFGFNRTDAGTWVKDRVKGILVSILFGLPLLGAILLLFVLAGEKAWLYCWILSAVFTIAVQFIFPTWILPLFNRWEPLADGDLRDALSSYAQSVGFALTGIFVIDGSRRSSRANAFFTGLGRNKRIALFDTLIERQSTSELVAVLAHEVGHYKRKHIFKGMILNIVHSGIMFYLLGLVLQHQGLYDAFFIEQRSVYTGLVLFGLLYTPVELLLGLFFTALSRKHEFEADRYAAETIPEPQAMISALKKLSADNLMNLTPHPFYVALTQSHPPVLQRIRALKSVIAEG